MTGQREASWALPSDPEFVSKARGMVGETLLAWGMPGIVEDVQLIVSELYTNALRHGRPHIALTLCAVGPLLRGAVSDCGEDVPRVLHVGSMVLNGRGLSIVAMLADQWGVDPLPDGAGKTVWFSLKSGRAS